MQSANSQALTLSYCGDAIYPNLILFLITLTWNTEKKPQFNTFQTTLRYSKADSIADTYMLIVKRQVQPKELEPVSLVYKATEP